MQPWCTNHIAIDALPFSQCCNMQSTTFPFIHSCEGKVLEGTSMTYWYGKRWLVIGWVWPMDKEGRVGRLMVDGNERGRWAEHCSVSRWRVNIKLSSYFLCQLQSWTLPRAGYRRHTKLQMLDCRCLEWVWAVDLRRMASLCKCEREQIWRRGSECVNKMSRHKIGSHPGSRSVCAKYSRAWF